MSNFSENLKYILDEQSLTVKQLALMTDLNISTVNRYLENTRVPSYRNAIKIADCLCCSLDLLFGRIEYEKPKTFKPAPPFGIHLSKDMKDNRKSKYSVYTNTSISEQRLTDWMNGTRLPSIPNLIVLANFFGCSLDELVGRED